MEKKVKISELEKKDRIPYIWEYYKPAIFGILFAIIAVVYIIYRVMNPGKTSVMELTMVNTAPNGQGNEIWNEFLTEQGYDTDKYEVANNCTLNLKIREDGLATDASTHEVLYTLFAAGAVDSFVTDENVFNCMLKAGVFHDLREILPAELIEEQKENLVYYEDEESGEKFPAGIILPKEGRIEKEGMIYQAPAILGFSGKKKDTELLTAFAKYLLDTEYEK